MFRAFRKSLRVDDDEVGIKVLLVALAARMTRWTVGGRRSYPFVSFSASLCEATEGWSAYIFFNFVVMSLKTPVRPVWSCGAFLDDAGRLISYHRRNQTRTRLYVQRDNGAAMTRGNFTATA